VSIFWGDGLQLVALFKNFRAFCVFRGRNDFSMTGSRHPKHQERVDWMKKQADFESLVNVVLYF